MESDELDKAVSPDHGNGRQMNKESTVTKKVNGGTVAENIVKANGKVSTNGKAKRAEFVQTYGKKIAATWAALTGKSKCPTGVQKKLPELNTWQVDYALVKLGLKENTCKAMLQWIRDDEANVKEPQQKPDWEDPAGSRLVDRLNAERAKSKSKDLLKREAKELASVARFQASSTPSEVVCAGLK